MASSNKVALVETDELRSKAVKVFENRKVLTAWLAHNVDLADEKGESIIKDDSILREAVDASFQDGVPLRYNSNYLVAKWISGTVEDGNVTVRKVLHYNGSFTDLKMEPFEPSQLISDKAMIAAFKINKAKLEQTRVVTYVEPLGEAAKSGFCIGDVLLLHGRKTEVFLASEEHPHKADLKPICKGVVHVGRALPPAAATQCGSANVERGKPSTDVKTTDAEENQAKDTNHNNNTRKKVSAKEKLAVPGKVYQKDVEQGNGSQANLVSTNNKAKASTKPAAPAKPSQNQKDIKMMDVAQECTEKHAKQSKFDANKKPNPTSKVTAQSKSTTISKENDAEDLAIEDGVLKVSSVNAKNEKEDVVVENGVLKVSSINVKKEKEDVAIENGVLKVSSINVKKEKTSAKTGPKKAFFAANINAGATTVKSSGNSAKPKMKDGKKNSDDKTNYTIFSGKVKASGKTGGESAKFAGKNTKAGFLCASPAVEQYSRYGWASRSKAPPNHVFGTLDKRTKFQLPTQQLRSRTRLTNVAVGGKGDNDPIATSGTLGLRGEDSGPEDTAPKVKSEGQGCYTEKEIEAAFILLTLSEKENVDG